jgi:hypothetical protein
MGWFDFTVSMPPSEAKPEKRYKNFVSRKDAKPQRIFQNEFSLRLCAFA